MFQQKGFMRTIALIGVTYSPRLGSTTTIPLAQSINSSPIDSLSANITTVGANIDSRFHIETNFLNILVNQNDCLMNVVIAMGILSAKQFTGPVESTTYHDPRYPRVFITTKSPATGGPIEARFLLWGLYLGIRPMLQTNDWRLPQFILFWDGERVGSISFGTSDSRLPLQGSNSTESLTQRSTNSSNPNALSIHTNGTQTASPNPISKIDVEPTSFGAPQPKINIFMAVLECLLYLAPQTTTEGLLAFSATPFPYNVVLRLRPVFRTQEPFFDYGVAGLALATVPSKLISQRHQRWTEVKFNYVLDGVLVGKGEIARARP